VSPGFAAPGRVWLLVSKVLLLAAYTSWVLPHVLEPSVLNPELSSSHNSSAALWTEVLHEHLFTQLPSRLHQYLPRTPAQFFTIGSCTFAVALAVQGQPLELHFPPCAHIIHGAFSCLGCIVIRGPSAALIIDTVCRGYQPHSFEFPGLTPAQIITWGTGFHFMFLHGWGGGPSMDMSRGHEMMAWCAA
jgi:hypothetical protein